MAQLYFAEAPLSNDRWLVCHDNEITNSTLFRMPCSLVVVDGHETRIAMHRACLVNFDGKG